MIVELEDGTTVSFRGGAVRINGVPERELGRTTRRRLKKEELIDG
jgi:hypothetical protein